MSYRFGEGVVAGEDLAFTPDGLSLPGLAAAASFGTDGVYSAYRSGLPANGEV